MKEGGIERQAVVRGTSIAQIRNAPPASPTGRAGQAGVKRRARFQPAGGAVPPRCPTPGTQKCGTESQRARSQAQPRLVDLAQAAATAAAGAEEEEVDREAPPDLSPATRAPSARQRPSLGECAPAPQRLAASARRLPGRRRPGPARPRVRRCPRAGAPGRPRQCAVPGPGRRPPWG